MSKMEIHAVCTRTSFAGLKSDTLQLPDGDDPKSSKTRNGCIASTIRLNVQPRIGSFPCIPQNFFRQPNKFARARANL